MSTLQQQQRFLTALFELGRPSFPPMHLSMEGLTKGEFYMLNLIYDYTHQAPDAPGMYVSALAEQMRVSPPAVSRMLRGMERKGYLERMVDRNDRRTTYILLTPEGVALRRFAEQRALDFTGRVIDRMGMEEIDTLLSLWTRLKRIIEDEVPKEGAGSC